jgi:hypothetical protein
MSRVSEVQLERWSRAKLEALLRTPFCSFGDDREVTQWMHWWSDTLLSSWKKRWLLLLCASAVGLIVDAALIPIGWQTLDGLFTSALFLVVAEPPILLLFDKFFLKPQLRSTAQGASRILGQETSPETTSAESGGPARRNLSV